MYRIWKWEERETRQISTLLQRDSSLNPPSNPILWHAQWGVWEVSHIINTGGGTETKNLKNKSMLDQVLLHSVYPLQYSLWWCREGESDAINTGPVPRDQHATPECSRLGGPNFQGNLVIFCIRSRNPLSHFNPLYKQSVSNRLSPLFVLLCMIHVALF